MSDFPPILYKLFEALPRQGPGSNTTTRHVLSLLPDRPARPTILDVGCGSGMQTLELARLTRSTIIAVDNNRPVLQTLQRHAIQQQLYQYITIVQGSMFDLCFAPQTFDLIWAEGSIFIMGFEQGLTAWHPLLKPGGFLVVSELTWLKPNPPADICTYWEQEGADIRTIEENLHRIAQTDGYQCLCHVVMPQADWWDNFYHPMDRTIQKMRQTYQDDPDAQAGLDQSQREVEMHRAYGDYYGYVFYIMQWTP
jgi:ubiquinone/menaquinone biosynthesis C-methylase UbiE